MANEVYEITKGGVTYPLQDRAAFPRSEQAVLGAVNLIPFPYADGMNKETNGITFTVQNDGSVVANGTATAGALFELWKINTHKLITGQAIDLSGGIDNKALIQYWAAADFDYKAQGSKVSFTPSTNAQASGRLTIYVDTGKTLDNAIFRPMIKPSIVADDNFVPPALSNRELTIERIYKKGDIININYAMWVGLITGGSKEIHCFIPLNKPINKDVTGISFSDDTIVNIRSNGEYLISNGYLSNYTISYVIVNDLGISFRITKTDDTTFASFNNMPASVQVISNGKLTLT